MDDPTLKFFLNDTEHFFDRCNFHFLMRIFLDFGENNSCLTIAEGCEIISIRNHEIYTEGVVKDIR